MFSHRSAFWGEKTVHVSSRSASPFQKHPREIRNPALRMCSGWFACALVLLCTVACRDDADKEVLEVGDQELRYHSVPDTPLEVRIPEDWTIESPTTTEPAGSAESDSGQNDPNQIVLQSNIMLSARAAAGELGSAGRPWLMVLHDPGLPKSVSPSLYLRAQRASNQGATRLQHVETEQTQRSGRSGFYLRDAFEVPVGAERKSMSQQSLLVLDTEPPVPSGYAIVITALEEDRKKQDALFRAILKSVRFRKSPQ